MQSLKKIGVFGRKTEMFLQRMPFLLQLISRNVPYLPLLLAPGNGAVAQSQ